MLKKIYKLGFMLLLVSSLLVSFYPKAVVSAQVVDPQDRFVDLFPKPPEEYDPVGQDVTGVRDLILFYMRVAKQILAVLAILFIVIAGLKMVTAGGNADTTKKSTTSIFVLMFGLILMQMAETFVAVFFSPTGQNVPLDVFPGGLRSDVVNPLLNFLLTFLAVIAVFVVILSGVRIILATGDDGKIKKQQRVLITTVLGLLVILVARPLVASFYGETQLNPRPRQAIDLILQVSNYILGFSSITAMLMLLYAGVSMVANFGNDQRVQKARKTILYVVLGIALIISAYTIVVFFIAPNI